MTPGSQSYTFSCEHETYNLLTLVSYDAIYEMTYNMIKSFVKIVFPKLFLLHSVGFLTIFMNNIYFIVFAAAYFLFFLSFSAARSCASSLFALFALERILAIKPFFGA